MYTNHHEHYMKINIFMEIILICALLPRVAKVSISTDYCVSLFLVVLQKETFASVHRPFFVSSKLVRL